MSKQRVIPNPHPMLPVETSQQQALKLAEMRREGKCYYDWLSRILPNNRYGSLALTAFEEAMMWATKSVTHDPEPQE